MAAVALLSTVFPVLMNDPGIKAEAKLTNFKQNFTLTLEAIKKGRVSKLLVAKCILHGSPSYAAAYTYYLVGTFGFSPAALAGRSIGAEVAVLVGVFSLTWFFDVFTREKFIKFLAVSFVFVSFSVIPVLNVLENGYSWLQVPAVIGLYSLTFFCLEMLLLAIRTFFIEICPHNLEAFFMSIVAFLYYLFRSIGLFGGSMLIYCLSINVDNFSNFPVALFANWCFIFAGCSILILGKIPSTEKRIQKSAIIEMENRSATFLEPKENELGEPSIHKYKSISQKETINSHDAEAVAIRQSEF